MAEHKNILEHSIAEKISIVYRYPEHPIKNVVSLERDLMNAEF